MSIAYDVLNDMIMSAEFAKLSTNEITLAKNHIDDIEKLINLHNAVFIMDRGYTYEALIRKMIGKTLFLFQLRSKFNKEIDKLSLKSCHQVVRCFRSSGYQAQIIIR